MNFDKNRRLIAVEDDIKKLKTDIQSIGRSNQYLREQNRQILKEIIKRNTFADKQDFEIKKITKQNHLKMFGMIFSSSGLTAVFLEFLLKVFK